MRLIPKHIILILIIYTFVSALFAQDTPVANDDFYSINEDEVLQIVAPGILENDEDDNPLIAELVQSVSLGTLILDENGAFIYTPYGNVNGVDVYTYWAFDGSEYSNIASVTLTINPVNDIPQVLDEIIDVDEDSSVEIVLNGTDLDEDDLTFELTSFPINGTYVDDIYIPNTNFNGTDSFSYRAFDGITYSIEASVTVNVIPVNDPPEVEGETFLLNEDETLEVSEPGLLENDSDIDGDMLIVQLSTDVENGELILNNNGSFTYNPNSNYNGTDEFKYKVFDGQVQSQDIIVELIISPVDDSPLSNPDSYSMNEDEVFNVESPGVLSNDLDVDGDNLSAEVVGDVSFGLLSFNNNGSFNYIPNENFFGVDNFTYQTYDGGLYSQETQVTILVNSINDPPIVNDLLLEMYEDSMIEIQFVGSDVENDDLDYSVQEAPQNGEVYDNYYYPNENFNGIDSFTYRAFDGAEFSNIAQVIITILAVNDTPISQSDNYEVYEDEILEISENGVLDNDSDPDMQNLSATLIQTSQNGELNLLADGTFTYTPNSDYNGEDSFSYSATDGDLYSDVTTVTITVIPVNDSPEFVNLPNEISFLEDSIEIINFTEFVNDIDGDQLELSVQGSENVTPSVDNLTVSFSPETNWYGSEILILTLSDNQGRDSISEEIILTLIPVNDAPIANNNIYNIDEDSTIEIILTGEDSIELDNLTFTIESSPLNGILEGNPPNIVYLPNLNFNGSDSFTFSVTDDGYTDGNYDPQTSENATIEIMVNPINDPPTFSLSGNIEIDEDFANTQQVIVTPDPVPDDESVTENVIYSITPTEIQFAHLVFDPSTGNVGVNPIENGNGFQEFTITADDGTDIVENSFTVTINPVNDPPKIDQISFEDMGNSIKEDTINAIVTIDYSDIDSDTILNEYPFSLDDLTWDFQYNSEIEHLWFTPLTDSFEIDSLLSNWNGLDSIIISCSDDHNSTDTETFVFQVQQVNDTPIEFSLNENLHDFELDSTVFFEKVNSEFIFRLPLREEPQVHQSPEKLLFVWQRSSDIDVNPTVNLDETFELFYRIEWFSNEDEFVIVLKDSIPDVLFTDTDFCNEHLEGNEVCENSIFSDTLNAFWAINLAEYFPAYNGSEYDKPDTNLTIDLSGNKDYYWRAVAQNYEKDIFGGDPFQFSLTSDKILYDLELPNGEFYIHQNELVAEYFDLYIESSENIAIHNDFDDQIEVWVNTSNYPQHYSLEPVADSIYHIASSFIDTGLITLIFQGRDSVQNYGRSIDSVYYNIVDPRQNSTLRSPSGIAELSIDQNSTFNESGILVTEEFETQSLGRNDLYQVVSSVTFYPQTLEFNKPALLSFDLTNIVDVENNPIWKYQIMKYEVDTWKNIPTESRSSTEIISKIDRLGKYSVFLDETISEPIPSQYSLITIYPNPANASTIIKYSIPNDDRVNLTIYDILGRNILILVDEIQSGGYYELNWNFTNSNNVELVSGVYFLRLSTKNFSETSKIVILK